MVIDPVLKKRWNNFKKIRRGYYSLVILAVTYLFALGAELWINNKPLVIYYNNEYYFPIFSFYSGETFGEDYIAEAQYKEIAHKDAFQKNPDNVIIFPFIPYGYNESDDNLGAAPPTTPDRTHWLGTDDRGRDLLTRLIYGYRVSMTLALVILVLSSIVGVFIGAWQGFRGGVFDLICQRVIEIISAIPFLYLLILLASIFNPSIMLLVIIFCLFRWIGLSYFMRAEFLGARKKEYVEAAKSIGVSRTSIMLKHILPNTITPIITITPFSVSSSIAMLSALDFLGFGVPAPTASWGEILSQAHSNLTSYHLSVFPLFFIFITLLLVNFVGEAIREAFDPKAYFRYRG